MHNKGYGHNADDFDMDLCPWPREDSMPQQYISTPFSILIEFEAIVYSHLIRIQNFKDIQF